jgi:predicted alternative tryptophan synthase beta-subunit
MTINSEELIKLMKQVKEKGIGWCTVEQKIKVSHQVLDLYANFGPVPVTIIKNLNKLLEQPAG